MVDLRTRTAFAAGHVAGTFSFPLDGSFATYLGWLIPWGHPADPARQHRAAGRRRAPELVRIGIDRPAAAAAGSPGDWAGGQPLRSFLLADFAALAAIRHHRPVVVLDVRRNLEWPWSHIDGAAPIPLHTLLNRLSDIPDGEVWVHCRSGYRSSVAASILDAAGRTAVAVDDEFDHAARAGLPLVSGEAAGRAA